MSHHGFLRVAAAVPQLRISDCAYNVERILALMQQAETEQVAVLVFPELCLTGYTCADLFQQLPLQRAAVEALGQLIRRSEAVFSGLAVVGVPLGVDDQLFNCAALVHRGRILGVVPKSFIPNYKEFYEARWFAAAATARSREIVFDGVRIPFGTNFLFEASDIAGLVVGVEICEDLWVPMPPSSFQALHGATLLVNLSASNEVIGKASYRKQLVLNQSGRCLAAYVYASCGVWESTTDVVFGGHCLIAENGTLLAESRRFQHRETLLVADIDLDRLRYERLRTNSYSDAGLYSSVDRSFTRLSFSLQRPAPLTGGVRSEEGGSEEATSSDSLFTPHSSLLTPHSSKRLARAIEAHPFVPRGEEQLRERCEEIFQTQVAGLARRLEHLGTPPVALGLSGGLDSTLALLVSCKTMDALGVPRTRVLGYTLPGFGTTPRTRCNALALMRHLGVTAREVDIRELCLEEMRALGHRPFGINLEDLDLEAFTARLLQLPAVPCQDLVFENVQARMRTSILMNAGFVIGTGDVSELALGWCTYNGDHMSMYNPNSSIPKTLVKFLVDWAARNEFDGEARQTLLDVVATEISPELLPAGRDGKITQATEEAIGPYELHDFFLYHFLRFGTPPEKILYLAGQVHFDRTYTPAELRRWLQVFLCRFFASQFKRSCLPDGPKVGSVSLSPRGDWRMPSDAQAAVWLRWANAEGT